MGLLMDAGRDIPLTVYLLDQVDFGALLQLQRRLVYETSGARDTAILLLCEHPRGISVGRQGSHSHIHLEPHELGLKGWPVRWVNRGGGCLFHAPGQLAIYPVLPLDRLGLDVSAYLLRLQQVLLDVAHDCSVRNAGLRSGQPGVWVERRRLAHVGLAIRNWVSFFGAALNVNPNLGPFHLVDCDGETEPMTSIERERRLAVNPALVRQRVVERFMERFGLSNVNVLYDHPALPAKYSRYRALGSKLLTAEAAFLLQQAIRLEELQT